MHAGTEPIGHAASEEGDREIETKETRNMIWKQVS